MPADVTASTIRLSIVGDQGRADLSAPLWSEVSAVAESYAHTVGASGAPALATATGRALDPHQPVDQLGLENGDLLVALGGEPATGEAGHPAAATDDRRARPWAGSGVLPVAGLAAIGAGILAGLAGGLAALVCLAVLLAAALAAAVPLGVGSVRGRGAAAMVAPAFGAGAGLAVALGDGPGRAVLGVAVGAMGAVVVAAIARAFREDEDVVDVLDVWLVVAVVAAVVAGIVLVAGAQLTSVLALAFGIAVVMARLLPFVVLDVPDQALLDLDRLAVTAWSVRERRRSSRRRTAVRADGVREVVRHGQRLLSAGSVAIGVVVCVCGALLVVAAGGDLRGIGALVMVGLGGCALALIGRSMRARLPRLVMRVAAVFCVAFLGVALTDRIPAAEQWLVFAGCAGLGLIVVLVALAMGRGWRSIWWARMADIAETLTVVLVVAAIPLACGIFDGVRQLTS
ncbi:MAG: hypothetical protein ACRDPH_11575 [Marmoricola sp.]